MILVQYVVGLILVITITFITGLFETLDPEAYKDMLLSYSGFILLDIYIIM